MKRECYPFGFLIIVASLFFQNFCSHESRDCEEGACCDEDGYFMEAGTECDNWTEYQCLDFCGGPNRRIIDMFRFCTGSSALCDGPIYDRWWDFEDMDSCGEGQACEIDEEGIAQCVLCGENTSCVAGTCKCDFRNCLGVCCSKQEICHWNDTCSAGDYKLTPVDREDHGGFGISVSISEDFAIVGAPGESRGYECRGCGAAYFYQLKDGSWEMHKITAPDEQGRDEFGWSVSIFGNRAIIGSPRIEGPGAAYIFHLEAGKWVKKAKLTASEPRFLDEFGHSVSISEDVAIVGDPSSGDGGAVYFFHLINGKWVEKQKLKTPDVQDSGRFGYSLSISGDTVIVGAHLKYSENGDPNNNSDGAGAAYIYQQEDRNWVLKAELIASDSQPHLHFGYSVSVDGNRAAVSGVGKAYIFENERGEWIEKANLTTSDREVESNYASVFSNRVSLSGDVAIVGAILADSESEDGDSTGSVYVYKLENGQWVSKNSISAYDAKTHDHFGRSVSIHGNKAIVGAPNKGAAYIY